MKDKHCKERREAISLINCMLPLIRVLKHLDGDNDTYAKLEKDLRCLRRAAKTNDVEAAVRAVNRLDKHQKKL